MYQRVIGRQPDSGSSLATSQYIQNRIDSVSISEAQIDTEINYTTTSLVRAADLDGIIASYANKSYLTAQTDLYVPTAKLGATDWDGIAKLGSDGKLYRQMRFGEAPRLVADIAAYAAANPDPGNLEGDPGESNPFGLAVLSNGNALVTDSAANSVLRITPSGKIKMVARLPHEMVATDMVGAPGMPPMLPTEAVPTGITVGPDGHIYVGELKGFPFRPGSSRIWRIDPNATNAVCSADPAVKARRCQAWGSGFTSIASIAFDQTGALLVFEYAADGIGAFETGCDSPSGCPPAVLLRVSNGVTTELAPGELSEPGWLAPYGSTLYLTDGVMTGNGRLLSIDLDGGAPSPA